MKLVAQIKRFVSLHDINKFLSENSVKYVDLRIMYLDECMEFFLVYNICEFKFSYYKLFRTIS